MADFSQLYMRGYPICEGKMPAKQAVTFYGGITGYSAQFLSVWQLIIKSDMGFITNGKQGYHDCILTDGMSCAYSESTNPHAI